MRLLDETKPGSPPVFSVAVSDRTTDELLDGLSFRDFLVLLMRAGGGEPRLPRNLVSLRRGPLYVWRAEHRLRARGLLSDDGRTPTADGLRAVRTGMTLFALESFDASR